MPRVNAPDLLALYKKVRVLEIKVRRLVSAHFAGLYRSAFKGSGLEFDEVRAYQYGDDVRTIDWKVTAKSDQAYVKVFREERELTVFVLFDVSGSENFGGAGQEKLQVGMELCALLALSAQENNDKFGLATFTDKVELYCRPTKGRRNVLAILAELLGTPPAGKGTSIRHALEFFRRVQKRRSVLFVLSDFLDEDYERQLVLLQRQHEVNLIRLYHPDEVLQVNLGIIPIVEAETGAIRWVLSGKGGSRLGANFAAIHTRLQSTARTYNMGYIPINVSQDYQQPMERFFRNLSRPRRSE